MRRLLALSLVLCCFACDKAADTNTLDPAAAVPADNEVTGWTRSGTLDSGRTEAELTALVGAAAATYVANGAAKLCRQHFAATISGTNRRLELRVADMADSAHAAAVYAAFAAAGQVAWTGDNPGRAARLRQDSLACEVDFWVRNFHVWLRVDTGSAAAVEAARFFSLTVAHKADTTEPAPPRPRDAVELAPASDEISGWTRTGSMAICETPDQLLALIDGEGQTYIDNGFVKAAFQSYSGTVGGNPVQLDLRIFDQADTAHCAATFDAVATGSEQPWTGDNPGRAARIEQLLFAYKVDFWDGKFYAWITIQDNTDAGLAVAKLFALNIGQAIQAAD